MEGAPVTAATGVLGPVLEKLGALLGSEYKLPHRTRNDIKFIKSNLQTVHSILWAIWEKEILDAESKHLKKKALDLAADMDDAVDDFILTMERSSRNKHLMAQIKIEASPFQGLKTRVDDVSDRCCTKWKWEKNKCAEPIPSKPPPRAPFVRKDTSEIIGMGRWRDDLIRHLVRGGGAEAQAEEAEAVNSKESEEERTMVQPQLKIATIVGMAGVGKTTLARLVYEEIESKFQSRAFVSVTPSPVMKEVLTSILQQVEDEPLVGAQSRTEKDIIHTISNSLKDKRYLVIIDDIWHHGEWNIIRKSFPENNLGSRIIITTRIESERVPGYDLENNNLYIRMNPEWSSEQERWVYGLDKENVAAQMKPDLVREGFDCDHPIVRMCGGVPLALLCMFSAMAIVREQQEQQGVHVTAHDVQVMIEKQVKRSGIQNTPGFQPLAEGLQIGYDDLPHHMLKTCLLYCGIYPKNYRFDGNHLVRQWAAEGFTYKEDEAKDYLVKLDGRGFMLRNGYNAYRMNPMMRNFLRWKSREDNFITCSSDITSAYASPVHRLCIDDHQDDDGAVEVADPFSGLDWSQIRSLVVFEGAGRYVPFEKLICVRVLDFLFTRLGFLRNDHVKDICGLFRVRHLFGLEGTGISEIPPEIAKLQHLETLQVRHTWIRELPGEIGELQQLKTLDVSRNRELIDLPREVGELQNLKRLLLMYTKVVTMPAGIWGLKNLKILEVDDIIDTIPWEAGGQLPKLEAVPECIRQAWKNSDILSELAGEILSIKLYVSGVSREGLIISTKHMHIPRWIKHHFNDLRYLDIMICKLEEQDLEILREMSKLYDLTLRFQVVPRQPIAISGEGFRWLETLVVDSRTPPVITFQEGAMPRLVILSFEFQFNGGPPANRDPLGIKHLLRLSSVEFRCNQEWYGRAESIPSMSVMIDVVRKEAQEHPNKIRFRVTGREEETFPANKSAQVPDASSCGSSAMKDEILEA
ncbi:disease resistance protein PIK5-NP-like [Triticum dicoccoides]|uniref:disease resistance protein PIK5-NP-like n=1 Tax=Triticum dicoccoides TaxID=85692 RepID=UPI000E7920ED|nr:disease resistance protein PIK5-NP-like [Triticum dicoccoides]